MEKRKLVSVAKGKKVSTGQEEKLRKRAGGSNYGKYKNVSPDNFAGKAGGAPNFSFPINTKKRAKAALSYAHHAPNPSGIKNAVYKKYPSLKEK